MKTRLFKYIVAMVLLFTAIPMHSQNYLKIWFKDGHTERHYMHLVESISTTKYDLEGNLHDDYQMQQIVMPDTTYSYYIADIDSMSFKKVDEDEIVKDVKNVTSRVETILKLCKTFEDFEQHLDEIRSIEGVEEVSKITSGIAVRIRNWRIFTYTIPPKLDVEGDESFYSPVRSLIRHEDNSLLKKAKVKNSDKLVKFAIANKLHGDVVRYGEQMKMELLNEELNSLGFDSKYLTKLDLKFFTDDIYNYDHVLLNTHGGYFYGKHWLKTDERVDPEKFDEYLTEQLKDGNIYKVDLDDLSYDASVFGEGSWIEITLNYYLLISDDFIQRRKGNTIHAKPSIFFNGACQSLKGSDILTRNVEPYKIYGNDKMAKAFINKDNGFDIYIGYNQSNHQGISGGVQLFRNMLNGQSEQVAFSNLKPKYLCDTYIALSYPAYLSDICYETDLENNPRSMFIVKTKTKEPSAIDFLNSSINGELILSGTTTMLYQVDSPVRCGFSYIIDGEDYPPVFCDLSKVPYTLTQEDNVAFSTTLKLTPGQTVFYRAFTFDGVNYNWGEERSFTFPTPVDIPAEAKDLGLPSGTKWASYNVGAKAPEEYGDYIAWGELKEKDVFNESNYQFCKNGIYANLGDDIGGTEYDVARERWGGEWMMPNKQMMQELYEYCTTKWTTQNDVYGTLFTGPNGESIFLPAAGYRKDDQQMQAGVWGDYWASTASEANTYSAYELYFKDGLINCDYVYNDNPTYRRNGHTVRPVIPGLQLTTNGPLSILMGDSETIGIRYGSGSYRYEVDKEGIVSVDITGSTITIHAFSGGDAVVTVIDDKGGKATISVAVKAIPEAKDLGLPSGTKWATFNIGANSPEDYGEYYSWGENGVKDTYSESTYEYCKNGMYTNIGKDIRGTGYDTAREKWGGEWMMPSTTQFNELISNCTSEWTTINGVKGRKFTSKINGEYIFFPAAGYIGSKLTNTGTYGYYWSGNIDPDNAEKAYTMISKNATPSMPVNPRCLGFSVRPVISGLELSATGTLSMFEGNSRTVTIRSGSGSYQPEVDQEGVVSVNITGTTITINALKIGDVVFTVTDTKGGQKANIIINVRAVPKAIDLGLPSGTKWANVNVGANSPEEFGDYYAWGETETKSVYTTSTYKYYKSSSYVDIGYDIRGSEYDAAQAKWGDKWKMPSSTQINELIANCTSEWTTVNGVNGLKFISKINGDSIFLPAVGYCESEVSSSGTSGYYWACDKVTDKNNGYNLGVKSSGPSLNAYSRYCGFAVRPVIRENNDDPRMDEVIPDNIRDKFKDHMPIYGGTNPPNIEGSYLIKPYTVVFCEDGNWEPGHVIESYNIKFYNQTSSDNTIDMIKYNVEDKGDYSIGTGAFISGDGTHFTAYFSAEGSSSNIRTLKSIVISGTKTDKGIEDLVYGFVMVDKGSDPDNKLMKTGVFRAFKDGDGISGPTTWEFDSNARQTNRVFNAESETNSDCCGQGDNNSLGLIGNSESVKPE